MKFRFFVALLVSKISYRAMRMLGKKASYIPGALAIKICPKYLQYISKAKYVICVSGTDGKTTTSNLISDLLKNCGLKVANNRSGSNTNIGIATAMSRSVTIFNKCKVDAVVLECDEHYTRIVCPQVKSDYLIVTNLLRDSLQRNAHPEYVFNKINMTDIPTMKVILNADELCSSELLKKNPRIYFGIDKLKTDLKKSKNIINDYPLCPKCDHKLEFDYVRYNHIGKVICPNCGFMNKKADYHITSIDYKNQIIEVNHKKENYTYPLTNDSLFNIYNEITAITLLMDMGLDYDTIYQALDNTKLTETRFAEKEVNGIKLIKMMAKGNNSLPVSLVFDYIRNKKGNKCIIFHLDDYDEKKENSSERIGWIYDCDYEFLKKENIKQIIVTGPRAYDHVVRLLLAGIDKKRIICEPDESKGILKIDKKHIDTIYLLHDMSSYELSVKAEKEIIDWLGEA